MSIRAKTIVYANAVEGEPKLSNMKLVEEDLPALKEGEVLIEALYLGIDPLQRQFMNNYPLGSVMTGIQTAK